MLHSWHGSCSFLGCISSDIHSSEQPCHQRGVDTASFFSYSIHKEEVIRYIYVSCLFVGSISPDFHSSEQPCQLRRVYSA